MKYIVIFSYDWFSTKLIVEMCSYFCMCSNNYTVLSKLPKMAKRLRYFVIYYILDQAVQFGVYYCKM